MRAAVGVAVDVVAAGSAAAVVGAGGVVREGIWDAETARSAGVMVGQVWHTPQLVLLGVWRRRRKGADGGRRVGERVRVVVGVGVGERETVLARG